MEFVSAPESWPFAVALIVILVIGVIEGISIVTGASVSGFFDSHFFDAHVPEGILGWLHLGKVPVLILLVLFLGAFSATGFAAQAISSGLLGQPLPLLIASALALLFSLPVVRVSGSLVARIMPRDETYAVEAASFVGRTAVLIGGDAHDGLAAQAKLRDEHGRTHYVMVEPDTPSETLTAGTSVLLVRQIGGSRFRAIPNPKPEIL